jgi:hypothetical protein
LNKLHAMQTQIDALAARKHKLNSNVESLGKTVNSKMNEHRIAVLAQVSDRR